MSTLTAAILEDLVEKLIRRLRINIDSAQYQRPGLAVFCSATDATAATVAVSDTAIDLVITGGTSAGSTTKSLTDSATDTLEEMVSVIEALAGWEATLLGEDDIASAYLVRRVATNALLQANEVTLSYFDQTHLERLIEQAWAAIEKFCDTDLLSTTRTELYDTQALRRELLLRRFPVTGVEFVGLDTADALRVRYSGSATFATVEITDVSVILREHAGTTTTTTITFAAQATTALMATAISATAGWTASAPNTFPSTMLLRRGAQRVRSGDVGFEAWEPGETDYEVDYDSGAIRFHGTTGFAPTCARARVDYTAGYATIPADVELALLTLTKRSWDATLRDSSLSGERLGDYSWTAGSMAASLADSSGSLSDVADMLAPYRRITV